jgi:hypothetical protein
MFLKQNTFGSECTMLSHPQACLFHCCANNQQATWSLLYNNVLCHRQGQTEETLILSSITCSPDIPYNSGMQAAELHSLPLALTVSQLMFVDNTGHGRSRGVYASMEVSEKRWR